MELTYSPLVVSASETFGPTAPTNSSPAYSDEKEDMSKRVENYLWVYIAPFIFLVGICGNSLVIAVMRRKRLLGTTTSVYLPLLAIADSATLLTGLIPDWMDACGFVVFKEIHPWTCKFEKFLFYTSADTAIWLLVAFTFDRYIAVCFPLKKRIVCVPKRAMYAGLVILIVAITKNFHVFWTRGAQYDNDGIWEKNCGQPEPYTHFEKFVRPWIALTIVTIIPFLVLVICNCLIIKTLLQVHRNRLANNNTNSDRKSSSAFTQTTLMCLSASFTFLVCISPSIVLLIGKPYWTEDGEDNDSYQIAKAVINQFVFVNHSVNFFLYCLTGERFRLEMIAMIKRTRSTSAASPRFQYTKKGLRKSKPIKRKFSLEVSSIQVSREVSEDRDLNGVEKSPNTQETSA